MMNVTLSYIIAKLNDKRTTNMVNTDRVFTIIVFHLGYSYISTIHKAYFTC